MSEHRGRILFIAYYFPPASTSGVFRSLGFARYLSRMGWKVQVLTGTGSCIPSKDYKLLENVPSEIEIIEAPVIDIFRLWAKIKNGLLFLKRKEVGTLSSHQVAQSEENIRSFKAVVTHLLKTPDSWIGWFFPALFKTLNIEKPDIIYSSAPPFTGHLIALALKKRWSVPFICDFRDPWIDNPFRVVRPSLAERWDRKLEKLVFKSADTIIANTDRMANILAVSYPDAVGRISVITNGFDPESFSEIKMCRDVPDSKFLLLHLGSLYGSRNPENFLLGLQKAIFEHGCNQFKIQLIGVNESISGESLSDRIAFLELSPYVDVLPSIPHSQALSRMKGADMLLLFSQGTKIQVPAKVYEYIGFKNKIFAVCDANSATKDIMDKLGNQHSCCVNNVEKISVELTEAYRLWLKKDNSLLIEKSSNNTEMFQREFLSRQLESLMLMILKKKDCE